MATAIPMPTSNETLQRGFKSARSAVRSMFRDSIWVCNNLPGEKRRELDVLGSHLVRCLDMLDLESSEGLPLDVWKEIRDELSDAFCGNPATAEQAALAAVVERYQIPKQFIFDMVNGADYWIRFRNFQTWEQLDTFASNLGGSAMAASCKLVGVSKPGYEVPALKCGKAIFLTQRLAKCYTDLKANRNFLAAEDLDRFKLEIHRVKMKQECPELKRFVRFTASRLEKLFVEAGKLIPYLNFDGARSVTSLLCMHWRMLTRLRLEPESIYNPQGVLTRRDLLGLKSRHVLGVEGGIPIIPNRNDHH
ncbi:squalene/phytoene synthase family protein [Mariniblastus fucicola]|uniref:All-trans-phytoene synthase n=1 Tax=Mariniblastus fucicola TaxID=980251 RepID=A0A5B9P8C6_9BACT|nr:squalene/phytoene synthase family protein [Mariniblastus fucicola]QEG21162.1 All-trans-phytoene synthase [Mariniblastus fucicola]